MGLKVAPRLYFYYKNGAIRSRITHFLGTRGVVRTRVACFSVPNGRFEAIYPIPTRQMGWLELVSPHFPLRGGVVWTRITPFFFPKWGNTNSHSPIFPIQVPLYELFKKKHLPNRVIRTRTAPFLLHKWVDTNFIKNIFSQEKNKFYYFCFYLSKEQINSNKVANIDY